VHREFLISPLYQQYASSTTTTSSPNAWDGRSSSSSSSSSRRAKLWTPYIKASSRKSASIKFPYRLKFTTNTRAGCSSPRYHKRKGSQKSRYKRQICTNSWRRCSFGRSKAIASKRGSSSSRNVQGTRRISTTNSR